MARVLGLQKMSSTGRVRNMLSISWSSCDSNSCNGG
jgi:hypothetical protein